MVLRSGHRPSGERSLWTCDPHWGYHKAWGPKQSSWLSSNLCNKHNNHSDTFQYQDPPKHTNIHHNTLISCLHIIREQSMCHQCWCDGGKILVKMRTHTFKVHLHACGRRMHTDGSKIPYKSCNLFNYLTRNDAEDVTIILSHNTYRIGCVSFTQQVVCGQIHRNRV